DEAHQHADGGGLAGAVRTEEAEDAARRDGQVETVDGELSAAVALGEAAGVDDARPRVLRHPRRLPPRGGPFVHRRPRFFVPAGYLPPRVRRLQQGVLGHGADVHLAVVRDQGVDQTGGEHRALAELAAHLVAERAEEAAQVAAGGTGRQATLLTRVEGG